MHRKGAEMLKLFTNNPEAADPVIPIRWCVSPETIAKLKQRNAENPHILLVITQGDRETRKLVPLHQMMEYVEFSRPGRHRIFAAIVWWSSIKELKKFYLEKGSYSYKNGVLDYYKNGVLDYDREHFQLCIYNYLVEEAELSVFIADGFFPKEPPAWEKRWVDLWFDTTAKDPCQHRRRRLFAYTIQPPVMLTWLALSVAARLLTALSCTLLLGMRKVDFAAIIHPFRNNFKNVYENASSIFLKDKNGKKRDDAYIILTPIVPLSIFFILFFTPLGILGRMLIALLTTGVATAGVYAISAAIKSFESAEAKRSRAEKKRLALAQEYEEVFQPIACTEAPLSATLKALPRNRRTLYLRYKAAKAYVCRPYAAR